MISVLFFLPIQFGETIGLSRSTSVTGRPGIPVHWGPAIRALPPFLLFPDPGLNTNFTHTNKIFKHLSVMRKAVVVEISDYGTGEILALSTVDNIWFLFRTQPYGAIPAVGRNALPTKAAVAFQFIKIDFINSHRQVLGNCLCNLFNNLWVVVTTSPVD
jgi:hypothetical protein